MPYPAGHRAATRARIVSSARRLFNQHGFQGVSIKQIMAGAGLTHGGFYDYFKAKSELYTEVLSCFLTDPNWQPRWEGVQVDLTAADAAAQVIRAYLSRQHFADIENSCPMVALPTDVRRNGPALQSAFETVFVAMVTLLEKSMQAAGSPAARRARAQAIASLCIGGLVVARALRTEHIADELRKACMDLALGLCDGGVSQTKRRTRTKSSRSSLREAVRP